MAASAVVIALAGCGGGGGDGSTSSTTAKINSDNAASVASRTYSVVEALYSSGINATAQVKSADGSSVGGPSNGVRLNLAEFATRRLLKLEAGHTSGEPVVAKAIVSGADSCAFGGSISAIVNDADNSDTLTSGDTGTITFTNCVDEDGIQWNGAFGFSNLSYTGSVAAPSRSVGVTFTFSNLRAAYEADSASVNGDLSVQAAITNFAPYSLDLTVAGTSLGVTENNWTETLTQYSARVFVDTSAGTYAYAVAGTVSGTDLPGAVTVDTPMTLAGSIGTYPTTGMVTARASDGTAARLVVNSATNVRIDVDANADGIFESSQTMTWTQL